MGNNLNNEKPKFSSDSHVHTEVGNKEPPQWWHTIEYSPIEVVKQAKLIGLDGLAITDHNTIKGLDESLNAAAKYGLIVVPDI